MITPHPEAPRCPRCNGPVWLVLWVKKLAGFCRDQCPELPPDTLADLIKTTTTPHKGDSR